MRHFLPSGWRRDASRRLALAVSGLAVVSLACTCGLIPGLGGASEDTAAFCVEASTIFGYILAAQTGQGSSEEAQQAIDRFAANAPPEIKADVELLSKPMWESGASADELEAAADRVADYLVKTCGLDPESLIAEDPELQGILDGLEQMAEEMGAAEGAMGAGAPEGPEPEAGTGMGEDFDPEAFNVFSMSSTGDLTFEHTGEASCSYLDGALILEFYPEQDLDLAYDAYALMDQLQPGSYEGEFGFYTPDEERAVGPATVAVESVEPLPSMGVVEIVGSIQAAYSGEVLGSGEASGTWRCLMAEEEAAGEY